MYTSIESQIKQLTNYSELNLYEQMLRGVEKEALRVTPEGFIAKNPSSKIYGLYANASLYYHRLLRKLA